MGYGESPQKNGVVGCETSKGKMGTHTHNVGFQFPTVYTYAKEMKSAQLPIGESKKRLAEF